MTSACRYVFIIKILTNEESINRTTNPYIALFLDDVRNRISSLMCTERDEKKKKTTTEEGRRRREKKEREKKIVSHAALSILVDYQKKKNNRQQESTLLEWESSRWHSFLFVLLSQLGDIFLIIANRCLWNSDKRERKGVRGLLVNSVHAFDWREEKRKSNDSSSSRSKSWFALEIYRNV